MIGRSATLVALWTIATAAFSSFATSDELTDGVAFWREKAFLCKSDTGPFPSKSSVDPNDCDDGDMTLFNGLLCASEEKLGCDAVAHSQSSDGRWWRSPRRIGWEYSNGQHDVSFSPDQALGVLHYVVHTRDTQSFDAWVNWINTHRQPINRDQLKNFLDKAKISINPFLLGGLVGIVGELPPHPTYCTDDIDLRCAFRLGDCMLINKIGASLGRDVDVCRGYFVVDAIVNAAKAIGVSLPPQSLALASSYFNDSDYPLHLAGVQIFLLQRSGGETDGLLNAAAARLVSREGDNPFFNYLAARKLRALDLTVNKMKCPTQANPSQPPTTSQPQEWSWERPDADQKWRFSMYWDCIFMANLLRGSN
jgi:hypothetical protein